MSVVTADVVRSEWTKLRSVRSTIWSLASVVVGMVGIAAMLSAVWVNHWDTMSLADRAAFKPIGFTLNGLWFAQLAIGVLGALLITSEYGTGTILSTLAAVPQRRTLLAAKAAVLAIATVVIGLVASAGAFFVGQAILGTKGIGASITDPGALQAVVGASLYLAVLGLLALAIGVFVRHTAGAIAVIFGLILVVPTLVQALPSSWANAISKYLPSNAGMAIIGHVHGVSGLSPWGGFALFCAYAAAALVAAGAVLVRRDA